MKKDWFDQLANKRFFCRLIGKMVRYECSVCGFEFWELFEEICDVCEQRSMRNCSYYKWQCWLWFLSSYFYWFIKVLKWSDNYYYEILANTDLREKVWRLAVYGFYSWEIIWFLTPRKEKLFIKTHLLFMKNFFNLLWILFCLQL